MLVHCPTQSLAQQFFQKSLEITHEMSHKLVLELQARNIQVIVAPYEADAQLAFLSKNGLIDFVITEDSDTIPFGCKRVRRWQRIGRLNTLTTPGSCCFSACSRWTRRATARRSSASILGRMETLPS